MVRDLMEKMGVTVIAVQDNFSPYELIREHAETKGTEMPSVADHADGRILKLWVS